MYFGTSRFLYYNRTRTGFFGIGSLLFVTIIKAVPAFVTIRKGGQPICVGFSQRILLSFNPQSSMDWILVIENNECCTQPGTGWMCFRTPCFFYYNRTRTGFFGIGSLLFVTIIKAVPAFVTIRKGGQPICVGFSQRILLSFNP